MRRWQRITCVLLPFAAAYFLTYAFRTINSVISQHLVSEVGLSVAELGLLTSVFFLSVAVVQLPLGSCLDRFGSRRVQIISLPVAAIGALTACFADDFRTLLVGRVLIGIGVASALMAGLKAIAVWFPRDRVALASGVLVTLGSLGAIATTVPAEALLPSIGWRGLFGVLAVATVATALLTYFVVPEATCSSGTTTGPFSGLSAVYTDPYFWRLAPLSTTCVAASWSLQGIWAARWLSDVEGLEQTEIVSRLFIMAMAISTGALLLGIVAYRTRERVAPGLLLAVVAAVSIAAQISLIMRWPVPSHLVWVVIAAAGASTVLSFSALTQHFPREIAGQANAALNAMHVLGAFLLQFVTGLIIQQQLEQDGHRPLLAFQIAFAAGVGVQAAAILWYMFLTRSEQRATPQHNSEANWDQWLPVAEASVKRWKFIALGSTLCSAFLGLNLITADSGISGQGNRSVFQAIPASVADNLAEHFLARFVQNIRSLSTDAVVVRSRWVEAYAFLTDKAARELTDEVHETKPFSNIGERAIFVDVNYVKRLSENAFEIRWSETVYPSNKPVEIVWFVAKVWLVPGATPNNPFELCIDAFLSSPELPRVQ